MKNTKFLKMFLAVAAVVAVSAPAFSQAATYAYVNQSGEVATVDAGTPNTAIATAPSIDEHSGVILLTNLSNNDLVGDTVNVK
jgi:hypothetical protein